MFLLVDSNLLVYAINESSPKHVLAKKFLQESRDTLFIAHQNITETLRVLTHPKFSSPMDLEEALVTLEQISQKVTVISPLAETIFIAVELIKKYKITADMIFDAYLVATAISHKIDFVVSDNVGDLKRFSEIKVINPFGEIN